MDNCRRRTVILSRDIRIIIAGSREFNDFELMNISITNYLSDIELTKEDEITIISGGAKSG